MFDLGVHWKVGEVHGAGCLDGQSHAPQHLVVPHCDDDDDDGDYIDDDDCPGDDIGGNLESQASKDRSFAHYQNNGCDDDDVASHKDTPE